MKRMGHNRDDLIRLFVAVELNDEVRGRLAEEQGRLQRVVQGVRWIPPEQMHITLVFIGDVFSGQVDGIAEVLESAARDCAGFNMKITGLGVFGSRHQPRVVWAGVGEGAAEAVALQARVVRGLSTLELAFDNRPFSPHLTLGRVKSSGMARGLTDAVERTAMRVYGTVQVDRLFLIRSELQPQGSVYTAVSQSFLSGAGGGSV